MLSRYCVSVSVSQEGSSTTTPSNRLAAAGLALLMGAGAAVAQEIGPPSPTPIHHERLRAGVGEGDRQFQLHHYRARGRAGAGLEYRRQLRGEGRLCLDVRWPARYVQRLSRRAGGRRGAAELWRDAQDELLRSAGGPGDADSQPWRRVWGGSAAEDGPLRGRPRSAGRVVEVAVAAVLQVVHDVQLKPGADGDLAAIVIRALHLHGVHGALPESVVVVGLHPQYQAAIAGLSWNFCLHSSVFA